MALNIPTRGLAASAAALALLSTAAPAHAANGILRVTSGGADGNVYIDGRDTGKRTPATFDDIPLGAHRVSVESPCARGTLSVDVAGPGATQVTVPMSEGTGTLVIHPTPTTASVTIDGQVTKGGQPLTVSCGSHAVNVSQDGHLPAVLTLEVAMDEILELPVSLAALGTGTLVVSVTPETAEVLVDGKTVSTGPVEDLELTAGPHVLRAQAEGYLAAERQFQLEDGGTRQFILALDPAGRTRSQTPRDTAGRGLRLGSGLAAAGVGMLGYGVYAGMSAAAAYDVYLDDYDAGAYADQDEADEAYDELVKPRRNAMLIGLGAGAAFTLTGVGVVIAF